MNISDSFSLRRRGLSALSGNWQTALMVTFVAGLLSIAQNTLQVRLDASSLANMSVVDNWRNFSIIMGPYSGLITLFALLQFILSPVLSVGLNTYFLALHRSENPPFALLFSRIHALIRCLALYVLMGIFIFLWSLLLLIPGIVAAYRYSMAPFLMADDPDLGALDAINMSKRMMDGHKGRLFALQLSFIGWAFCSMILIGILSTMLGILGTALGLFASLALQVYINSTVAGFYLELLSFQGLSDNDVQGRVE